MADQTILNSSQKESAKAYAQRVIEKDFGQTIKDEELETVAEKILQALEFNSPNQAR